MYTCIVLSLSLSLSPTLPSRSHFSLSLSLSNSPFPVTIQSPFSHHSVTIQSTEWWDVILWYIHFWQEVSIESLIPRRPLRLVDLFFVFWLISVWQQHSYIFQRSAECRCLWEISWGILLEPSSSEMRTILKLTLALLIKSVFNL